MLTRSIPLPFLLFAVLAPVAAAPPAQSCTDRGLLETLGAGRPSTQGVLELDTVGLPLEGKVFGFELSGGLPGA